MAETTKPAAMAEKPASIAATLPKTGIDIAADMAAAQPTAPPAGQKYSITEFGSTDAVIVASPDGSVEDAVRTFNEGKSAKIRTAKQLKIEKI